MLPPEIWVFWFEEKPEGFDVHFEEGTQWAFLRFDYILKRMKYSKHLRKEVLLARKLFNPVVITLNHIKSRLFW